MKFYPMRAGAETPDGLGPEYRTCRRIGNIGLGELHLFCRAGLKTYFIPYREVRRCFRRVQVIPRRRSSFELENLVICGDEGELAQIQLPGRNAARELMAELERLIPEAEFGKPTPSEG